MTDDIKLATLQHLYFRFLLGIGDSGTYNILVREDNDSNDRLIAGIDLEESRNIGVKERRLALLFSKAADALNSLLNGVESCLIEEDWPYVKALGRSLAKANNKVKRILDSDEKCE